MRGYSICNPGGKSSTPCNPLSEIILKFLPVFHLGMSLQNTILSLIQFILMDILQGNSNTDLLDEFQSLQAHLETLNKKSK